MPKPKPDESQSDFVSRCIPIVLDEGTAEDNEQAAAICYSIYREATKMPNISPNERLLKAIQERQQKKTAFNYGILTADKYVQTLLDVVGSDMCYHIASKDFTSFADVMEKAARTLVYSNEDAEVHEKAVDHYGDKLPDGVELPKNTLMVFRHTLTTPRKDRDGDILHPEGMEVDPKMLLLWQHVHTMPIGKMLCISEQNSKILDLWSCIVDMNETCHDSAVMVDNGMGRFSHGFKATEFDKVKGEDGFDIQKGEIMEESLVSVPANTDADTQEVILSLVEGGKLTSPVMKEVGKHIRETRPTSVPVSLDLKVTVNGQEVKNNGELENKTSPSEETKETPDEGKEREEQEKKSPDTEVKSVGYGTIKDSWEYTQEELRTSANGMFPKDTWNWVIATFQGYAIICAETEGEDKYYKCNWHTEDGETKFYGEKKEVEIEVKTEIIEKAKALSKFMSKSEKEEEPSSFDMSDWLATSTKQNRTKLIEILANLNKMKEKQARIERYRSLRSR